jgi:signal transduction histidine kinase
VVYRIAQEGLTNAHKHAPHASTTVSVERSGVGVVVAIRNEVGDRTADLPGSGSGLIGLAERVQLMGGTLDSGPQPGGGWRLRAELPWTEAAA